MGRLAAEERDHLAVQRPHESPQDRRRCARDPRAGLRAPRRARPGGRAPLRGSARERPRQEPAARAEALREALALWRGPPLVDVVYESFATQAATRLEELRVVARRGARRGRARARRAGRARARAGGARRRAPAARAALGAADARALPRRGARPRPRGVPERAPRARRRARDRARARRCASCTGRSSARRLDSRRPRPPWRPPRTALERRRRGAPRRAASCPVLGEDSRGVRTPLAARFSYPRAEPPELPRVSQYAAALRGYGPLYDELHELLAASRAADRGPPFFASLPPLLRARGAPHQLLVTTGYDRARARLPRRGRGARRRLVHRVGPRTAAGSATSRRTARARHRRPEHATRRSSRSIGGRSS